MGSKYLLIHWIWITFVICHKYKFLSYPQRFVLAAHILSLIYFKILDFRVGLLFL